MSNDADSCNNCLHKKIQWLEFQAHTNGPIIKQPGLLSCGLDKPFAGPNVICPEWVTGKQCSA